MMNDNDHTLNLIKIRLSSVDKYDYFSKNPTCFLPFPRSGYSNDTMLLIQNSSSGAQFKPWFLIQDIVQDTS